MFYKLFREGSKREGILDDFHEDPQILSSEPPPDTDFINLTVDAKKLEFDDFISFQNLKAMRMLVLNVYVNTTEVIFEDYGKSFMDVVRAEKEKDLKTKKPEESSAYEILDYIKQRDLKTYSHLVQAIESDMWKIYCKQSKS